MNNRQKAKHFKKLYEDQMRKTVPVRTVFRTELKHYAAKYLCNRYDDIQEEDISSELVRKFDKTLRDNVEVTYDSETGTRLYQLDIWLMN